MSAEERSRKKALRTGLSIFFTIWIAAGIVWIATASDPTSISEGTRPAVATNHVGDQMMIWESPDGALEMQLLDAFGTVVGVQFQMPANSDEQIRPDIAPLPSGDFIATWQDQYEYWGSGISAQRVSAFGTVVGVQLSIADSGRDPAIGTDDQGNSVIVFTDVVGPGNGNPPPQANRFAHFVQRVNAFGTVVGVQLRVGRKGPATPAAIAVSPDGGFLVAWEDRRGDISAQAFDRYGVALSDVFRVNRSRAGRQLTPDVTVGLDGNYIVAWEKKRSKHNRSVQGRRVTAFGTVVGVQFRISETPFSKRSKPAIAADQRGNVLVTWRCAHDSAEDSRILGRMVDLDGGSLGNELSIADTPSSAASEVSNGNAVSDFSVVWQGQSDEDSDETCVYVRQLIFPEDAE